MKARGTTCKLPVPGGRESGPRGGVRRRAELGPKVQLPGGRSQPTGVARLGRPLHHRNLLTPAGKIERLEVPRDREGEFVTEPFGRYKRVTGDVRALRRSLLEIRRRLRDGVEDRSAGHSQGLFDRRRCVMPINACSVSKFWGILNTASAI